MSFQETTLTKSESETYQKAAEIAGKMAKKRGSAARILCLQGDLGSGKTTFTKGVGLFLGLDIAKVQSPTYTFVKEHPLKKGGKLYHFDLYRVEEVDDLLRQDLLDRFSQKGSWVVIEWPERMGNLLEGDKKKNREVVEVELKYVDETSRSITVTWP